MVNFPSGEWLTVEVAQLAIHFPLLPSQQLVVEVFANQTLHRPPRQRTEMVTVILTALCHNPKVALAPRLYQGSYCVPQATTLNGQRSVVPEANHFHHRQVRSQIPGQHHQY